MSRTPYTTAALAQLGIDIDQVHTIGLVDGSGHEWTVQGYVKDVSSALVDLQDEDGRCVSYFTYLVKTIDGEPFHPPAAA